jgi:hypothetical protein
MTARIAGRLVVILICRINFHKVGKNYFIEVIHG